MSKKKYTNNVENQQDEVIIEEVGSNSFKDKFNHIKDNLFTTYQNYLIYGLLGIMIIIAGYFAYKFLVLAPKEKEAVSMMSKAQLLFERDSFAQALNKPGGDAMGFLDIIDNYGSTKSGNLAKYYAGICYLNMGKFQDAADYLKKYDEDELLTAITKFGALGDAYSELKDMDQAKSYYKKAIDQKPNDMLTPYYMFKLAMMLKSESKNEEAQEYFKKIKNNYPGSSLSKEVEKYIFPIEN